MSKVKEILDSLGIIDRESMLDYYNRKKDCLTQADIDILSPDVIDNKEFWKLATAIDNSSIVGGNTIKDNNDINRINYYNGMLAKTVGMLDYIIPLEGHTYPLLDIGCGYGALKNLLPPEVPYTGIDICSRIPEAIEVNGDGIPDLGMFDYVVSCNVFQHLSLRQKAKYTADAFKYLNTGGYFIVSFMINGSYPLPKFNNHSCIFTCGQFLELMDDKDYIQLLLYLGFTIKQINSRFDGMTCFICRKEIDG